ncbi:hypothetical protein QFC22_002558 [Naganishia vaughanmartiniae]|uniref:Uncharacterized protein n=1 Tax=Naganishia vaughanmartiniae TaxID=1424756 RepID=A0ACC2XB75_9TREE|nr:hypothetical protein QFC22_002558 [Naganishia vaughanmartiniae]
MFYNPAASPAPLHHHQQQQQHIPQHKLFQPQQQQQGDNQQTGNANNTVGGGGGGGGGWRMPGMAGNGNNAGGNVLSGYGGGGGHAPQASFAGQPQGYNLLASLQNSGFNNQGGQQAFSAFGGGGTGLTPGGGGAQHTLGNHGMGQQTIGGGQGNGNGLPNNNGQQQQQQGLLQALNGASPPGMRFGHLGQGGGGMQTQGMQQQGMGMGGQISQQQQQIGQTQPQHGGQVQPEIGGPYWEQQIIRAQTCRQAASPHHRAKASAIASRAITQSTSTSTTMSMTTSKALPILDPNRPVTLIGTNTSGGIGAGGGGGMTPVMTQRRPGSAAIAIMDENGLESPSTRAAHPTALSTPAVVEPEPELCMGLDLGGIKLRTLSPSLFAFSHVTALYINHNQLTSLSPAISHMRTLTHLDVTGNLLTSIPPDLGLLSHLKELLLFDNQLQDLPLELGTLHQLEFLGIEGNPLSESIRCAMAERGTQGLIGYFRDNCPAPPPPPPRKWEVIQEVEGASGEDVEGELEVVESATTTKEEKDTFSILCFNILCERYATHQMYGYTPSWALNWQHRKDEILKQILESGAHVVCLQEVDDEQYHDFFLPNMEERGYDGAFNPKTRARTMSENERRRVDGCATFWKTSKYALIERQVIEFNQVALGKADMRTEDMFNRIMSKDNISVACLLESTTTDSRLVVANAHIHWDPLYRDVKLVQVAMLIEEIEKLREQFARFPPKPPKEGTAGAGKRPFSRYQDPSHIAAIICGDFNSVPHSAVYEFLAQGTVPHDHEDFMTHQYGHYTNRGLYHKMGLKSAYAHLGELPLTNYTPGFEGAIDYIWYTTATLAVTELLGEVDKGYLSRVVGFPNAHFPSE